MKELINAIEHLNETLTKIERNQRYYTKVVLGTRVLQMPFSEASKLTQDQIKELGSK